MKQNCFLWCVKLHLANIPHLYTHNDIYYYPNNNVWKSLKYIAKKKFLQNFMYPFGITPLISHELNKQPFTTKFIQAYFNENGH